MFNGMKELAHCSDNSCPTAFSIIPDDFDAVTGCSEGASIEPRVILPQLEARGNTATALSPN